LISKERVMFSRYNYWINRIHESTYVLASKVQVFKKGSAKGSAIEIYRCIKSQVWIVYGSKTWWKDSVSKCNRVNVCFCVYVRALHCNVKYCFNFRRFMLDILIYYLPRWIDDTSIRMFTLHNPTIEPL
jgi:hypothetical protein